MGIGRETTLLNTSRTVSSMFSSRFNPHTDTGDDHMRGLLEDLKDMQQAEANALKELVEAARWFSDRQYSREKIQVEIEEYKNKLKKG